MKKLLLTLLISVSSLASAQESCEQFTKVTDNDDNSSIESNKVCINPQLKYVRVNKDFFKVLSVSNEKGNIGVVTTRNSELFIFIFDKSNEGVYILREETDEGILIWK